MKIFLGKLLHILGPEKFPRPAPPRPPPFSATENSALWPFLAKNRCFFSFCEAVEPPNGAGFMKIFLETLLDIFRPGRKNFGHPAHNSLFRPQKFLHMAIFRRKKPKIAIFCLFRLKIGQKRAKIKKKNFHQNFLSVDTFSNKMPKMTSKRY